jgi:hypothetical protein
MMHMEDDFARQQDKAKEKAAHDEEQKAAHDEEEQQQHSSYNDMLDGFPYQ